VPAPVAQVYWRRCFRAAASAVSQHVRAPLSRWLWNRVRRSFRVTKQLRQDLPISSSARSPGAPARNRATSNTQRTRFSCSRATHGRRRAGTHVWLAVAKARTASLYAPRGVRGLLVLGPTTG
jgi:hypothetical protein